MPEGPSIVILKEELRAFKNKQIIDVSGNSKIDIQRVLNLRIKEFKTWGKHFLIYFDGFFLKIHLLMFGTYRINERKDTAPRLSMKFKTGEINFYTCSIKLIEGNADDNYDWSADVMSENWDPKKAEKKLKALKKVMVCDALLNQEIFSGVGNIIKNEVLFRIKVHPESFIEKLPRKKLKEMVKEAHDYSWEFYNWKKKFVLKKHWLIYKKTECPRCYLRSKNTYVGKTDRLTSFCANCQKLYS